MPLTEPFPFGIERSRQVWHGLIQRYGDLALLRQPGLADRFVSYLPANFSGIERLGGISNPADRKALISEISPDSGLPLDPEPSEKDVLVTLQLDDDGFPLLDTGGNPQVDEMLKIVAPPSRVGPSRHVLYWRLTVRG
jgi:hypothetical protein